MMPHNCAFLSVVIAANGMTGQLVIDKSRGNRAGLQAVNIILNFTTDVFAIRQVKYSTTSSSWATAASSALTP